MGGGGLCGLSLCGGGGRGDRLRFGNDSFNLTDAIGQLGGRNLRICEAFDLFLAELGGEGDRVAAEAAQSNMSGKAAGGRAWQSGVRATTAIREHRDAAPADLFIGRHRAVRGFRSEL